jgi:hypothetical protein
LRTKHSQEGMDCNIPKHILIFIKWYMFIL